jgi:hypothetical protein
MMSCPERSHDNPMMQTTHPSNTAVPLSTLLIKPGILYIVLLLIGSLSLRRSRILSQVDAVTLLLIDLSSASRPRR